MKSHQKKMSSWDADQEMEDLTAAIVPMTTYDRDTEGPPNVRSDEERQMNAKNDQHNIKTQSDRSYHPPLPLKLTLNSQNDNLTKTDQRRNDAVIKSPCTELSTGAPKLEPQFNWMMGRISTPQDLPNDVTTIMPRYPNISTGSQWRNTQNIWIGGRTTTQQVQRSDAVLIEPPGREFSTGARRRDPQNAWMWGHIVSPQQQCRDAEAIEPSGRETNTGAERRDAQNTWMGTYTTPHDQRGVAEAIEPPGREISTGARWCDPQNAWTGGRIISPQDPRGDVIATGSPSSEVSTGARRRDPQNAWTGGRIIFKQNQRADAIAIEPPGREVSTGARRREPHNAWMGNITSPPDQRGDTVALEPPGPENSTGARKRDPQYSGVGQDRFGRRRNQQSKTAARRILTIPISLLGLLTDNQGSKIHEIESKTKVVLKVGNPNRDNTEVMVVISGTSDAINVAVMMIHEILGAETFSNNDYNKQQTSSSTVQDNSKLIIKGNQGQNVIDWQYLASEYQRLREERNAQLPPVRTEFYIEDLNFASFTPEDAHKWRVNNDMIVRRNPQISANPRLIPNPVLSFEQAFLQFPEMLHRIYEQGFKNPTPIQSQALPILMSGHDFICLAPNRTGKTLSVILSALIHIDGQPIPKSERNGPSVLFVAPNQDQIIQIQREILKFHYRNITCICVYRPGDRNEKLRVVSTSADIIVTTPERLYDLACEKYLRAINFTYIAFFEAEHMTSMGYEQKIRNSLFDLRARKQVVITSAAWSIGVRVLALAYMNDPIQLKLGTNAEAHHNYRYH